MSGSDDRDPFGDLPPLFGDLARMMQRQGPMSWDSAKQFAAGIASGGESEANVDPAQRFELEQLARVAELQVATRTGLPVGRGGGGVTVLPVNRAQWSARTLDDYRPLFDAWSTALQQDADITPDGLDDEGPLGWMAPLMQMLGPWMLGLTAGSMVGHLAQRAVGQYELPIPRPAGDELVVVLANLDTFGEEWSLPRDDLRLWVCLRDICHHAVFGVPHVAATLDALLRDWLTSFDDAGGDLDALLGGFDPTDPSSMGNLQSMFGDPDLLFGAVVSEHQKVLQPRLEALVAAVVGYVDWVMDEIGGTLIGSYAQVTEAMRRRRVEATDADRFVERIFGLELGQAQFDRGEAFAAGVVERAGPEGLHRLWEAERTLPTPAEIDAPGLWLARIDLPDE